MSHVLVVTPVYPPYKGGMGMVAAQEASLVRSEGHTVRVVTPRYAYKEGGAENDAYRVKPWFAYGNAAILPWNTLWNEVKRADVVHIHYPFFGTASVALTFAVLLRKRRVVSWHMRARAEKNAWMRRIIFFLHAWCEEPLIKMWAHAICVSTQDYGEVAGIPREKQYIVPFGVSEERFFVARNSELRERMGVGSEDCVLLFVGGMDTAHAFKGVEILLRAFAVLAIQNEKLALWLVGEGNLRAQYERQAEALGIQHRVHFFGGVSAEDLPKIYQGADVHILPSQSEAEAYGLVTCEAAATGIPSIVSALRGVRMLVENGVTGLHVEPSNEEELARAMHRLAENKEERENMGAAARKKMEKEASLEAEKNALLRAYACGGTLKE